jgi:hypothetical protein
LGNLTGLLFFVQDWDAPGSDPPGSDPGRIIPFRAKLMPKD